MKQFWIYTDPLFFEEYLEGCWGGSSQILPQYYFQCTVVLTYSLQSVHDRGQSFFILDKVRLCICLIQNGHNLAFL